MGGWLAKVCSAAISLDLFFVFVFFKLPSAGVIKNGMRQGIKVRIQT